MRNFVLFLFFSSYLLAFNYHLKPYKISEGIHCFFGLPSEETNINGGNIINSCYIETEDGYIVVDSGPTYSYAQDAYAIMEKEKKLPVKYVINTSLDEVHVLGNEFYKEQGAILFAPKGYRKIFLKNKPLIVKKILSQDALVNTRMIAVDNIIDKDINLILGDLNISLKRVFDDDNNIYIYIKDKKIVFAGDMIFNNRILSLKNNRSLLTWKKGLKEIEKLDWKYIISSHGYITCRSALKKTNNYLNLLESTILSRIKKGESREKIISNVILPSFHEDRLYSRWHFKNVATAYDELINISKKIEKVEKSRIDFSEEIKLKKKTIIKPKPKPKPKPKVPSIKYKNFKLAMKRAKIKNKIVLIKVRSTTCKYCDQLDRIISKNSKVRKILNRYFEVVKINIDYQSIPLNLEVRSTPTLIFIQPENKKILMKLPGIMALGEFLEILNEAVVDGHNGGYLKK